jgi:hypothetical protein
VGQRLVYCQQRSAVKAHLHPHLTATLETPSRESNGAGDPRRRGLNRCTGLLITERRGVCRRAPRRPARGLAPECP